MAILVSKLSRFPRKHLFAILFLFLASFIVLMFPSRQHHPVVRELPLNINRAEPDLPSDQDVIESSQELQTLIGIREHNLKVKSGDTLSHIFHNLRISAAVLQELLTADEEYLHLGNLQPGQRLKLNIDQDTNQLSRLELKIDKATTLVFQLEGEGYKSKLEVLEGVWAQRAVTGEINGSFYLSAKRAGLNAGQVQQIANLLQYKLNFKRQLRAGDSFNVLVSDQLVEGEKSGQNELLAVVLTTRHQSYSAFLHQDGRYYDAVGKGLNKAYRKYPTNKRYRISSSFNLKRRHPVTGKIRPHYGTDFATPTGTSVYSIGDAVVTRVGNHPFAGKYLVLKHGRKYVTRYLHLSKILVRKGQHVSMGQRVALSGNTGRSTGAHLHYELHVNGKKVNPMKVKLPLSESVPSKQKTAFMNTKVSYLKIMGVES